VEALFSMDEIGAGQATIQVWMAQLALLMARLAGPQTLRSYAPAQRSQIRRLTISR
jgi:hypothetical protein